MNKFHHVRSNPRILATGALGLCLLALLSPALAAPLDKAACAKLAQDMQNMKMLDIDKLMEKGAAWAASNLSDSDLSLVRQYIDLDEQLKFRCSAPSSLVHLKRLDDDDDEKGGAAKQADSNDGDAKKDQSGDGQQEGAASPQKRKAAKTPAKKSQPQPQKPGAQ